ncbi:GNAT family N-acetyltransferase [Coleofasciculus sp. F4-SAH-05]|uniref:GNAT family N-acetyltransferase n=1 Tax=Coleofasciculus sp. F4-SAH-05 TaxID=3069525 RepID=UPI0032FAA49C
MYVLNLLQDSTAVKFQRLTFSAYQFILHQLGSDPSMVAFGACVQEEAVGLALAEIKQNQSAEILSLFVEPTYRNKGIGKALLNRLEAELVERGCNQAELVYTPGKPTTPVLEKLLETNDWSVPYPRTLMCKAEAATVLQAPWMQKYSHLPSNYSICSWLDVTPEEKQLIRQQQAETGWIPTDLVPFQHEKNLEPLNSLALRYQGQIVGWLINHRLAPNTIRYTCSFVRQELQKRGRIISLYAEAAQRQLEADIAYGIWVTPLFHEPMVAFIKNRLTPYLLYLRETRGTYKQLNQTLELHV